MLTIIEPENIFLIEALEKALYSVKDELVFLKLVKVLGFTVSKKKKAIDIFLDFINNHNKV